MKHHRLFRRHVTVVLGLLVMLAASFSHSSQAVAESAFVFHLGLCTERAKVIAMGRLSSEGALAITDTIRATEGQSGTLDIVDGAAIFGKLKQAMAAAPIGDLDVVAFLERSEKPGGKWRPAFGYAGVVALAGDNVYLFGHTSVGSDGLDSRIQAVRFVKHNTLTRTTFIQTVRQTEAIDSERKRLLAMPPGVARIEQLLAFLQEHTSVDEVEHREHRGYQSWIIDIHFRAITRELKPLDAVEQGALLQRLQQARQLGEQLLLLRVLRFIPAGPAAFDAVAGFIKREYPEPVRSEAIWALRVLDSYRTAQALAPYLKLDEPLLPIVLQCLSGSNAAGTQNLFSDSVVEPLRNLAQSMMQQDGPETPYRHRAISSALLNQISIYAHPRLLPALYQWAMAGGTPSSEQALGYLQDVTLLKRPRNDQEWANWWKKAEPLLNRGYDLTSDKGLDQWLVNYTKADTATRAILIRSWLFEPKPAEDTLVRIAGAANEPANSSDAAKETLAYLWRNKRLAVASRKAIAARFLQLKIVQVPPAYMGSMEVQIVGTSDFPFPRDTWLEFGYTRTRPGEPLIMKDINIGNSRSIESASPQVLGSFSGGIGKPGDTLGATFVAGERERVKDGGMLWTHQWSLAPIVLRDLPVKQW